MVHLVQSIYMTRPEPWLPRGGKPPISLLKSIRFKGFVKMSFDSNLTEAKRRPVERLRDFSVLPLSPLPWFDAYLACYM
jgi:hypothetical protein